MREKILERLARLGHAIAQWAELRLCLHRLGAEHLLRRPAAPATAVMEMRTVRGQTLRAAAIETLPPAPCQYGPS